MSLSGYEIGIHLINISGACAKVQAGNEDSPSWLLILCQHGQPTKIQRQSGSAPIGADPESVQIYVAVRKEGTSHVSFWSMLIRAKATHSHQAN